jgi:hypothetical protein
MDAGMCLVCAEFPVSSFSVGRKVEYSKCIDKISQEQSDEEDGKSDQKYVDSKSTF